ncbi:hypothetical protein SAMN05444161_9299 [Rhizobiales bacterium GAS191]|nr:hypothetical protein SAMN05444161_9299 [Rhizobiales bacterium GAS191]
MNKTKILKFRIPAKTKISLEMLCAKTGQSASGLMRGLIERKLENKRRLQA